MPREVDIVKNSPPIIPDFAMQRADGGRNCVEITVCSIPALLAMKGYARQNRCKQKDACDISYCVRNDPGGPDALAEARCPLLEQESATRGYRYITEKFDTANGFGPEAAHVMATAGSTPSSPADRGCAAAGPKA